MSIEKPETLGVRCCRCYGFGCKYEITAIQEGVSDDLRLAVYQMFDDTSYIVSVGSSNTVQLRLLLLGHYPGVLEFLESLLCCLVWDISLLLFFLLFLSFLSRCNKDVFFNLRVSSLTESDLCKAVRGLQTLSNFQLLSHFWAARLQLITNWLCHGWQK